MDRWAWEQLDPWLELRRTLPVGALFCVLRGPTRGRPCSPAGIRAQLHRTALAAGVRRRFAPHQLRHAHAVEMSREGIPLLVIQRQLGHADLGITSAYLRGIDNTEIIHAVHERPAPMIPPAHPPRLSRVPLAHRMAVPVTDSPHLRHRRPCPTARRQPGPPEPCSSRRVGGSEPGCCVVGSAIADVNRSFVRAGAELTAGPSVCGAWLPPAASGIANRADERRLGGVRARSTAGHGRVDRDLCRRLSASPAQEQP